MASMDEEEIDYIESEDEDFNPEAQNAEENLSSSSDDEELIAKKTTKAPHKRKVNGDDELDSGDEVTIQEAKRKKRRKQNAGEEEDDSSGEGGLIKTRAQRAAEKEERQEYHKAHKGEVTVDVDALWTKLTSAPLGRRQKDSRLSNDHDATDGIDGTSKQADEHSLSEDPVPTENGNDEEFVVIKRTYEFAGQTISEEKRVHRDSAEAKLYLTKASDDPAGTMTAKVGDDGLTLRRPLKRASMFEPNPIGEVKDVLAQQKRKEEEDKISGGKAQRLNTVQKSAIDWASHVDSEGLKDELAEYDRSKQGYMSKMDFLQGVQGRRDEDERKARLQKV
ncbi:hypothetical protein ANO11243_087580 [Dothideomycetidae sp. 11243]|nr:hypothetical protein ANO11243_087580 [fungal sp. No.11243]